MATRFARGRSPATFSGTSRPAEFGLRTKKLLLQHSADVDMLSLSSPPHSSTGTSALLQNL